MNREDIICMAREAGFQCLLPSEHTAATGCIYDSGDDEITPLLERFAALIASAEREACIELVAFHGGPVDLEAAIRARGQA